MEDKEYATEFPREDVSPAEKRMPEYGAKYARAAFYSFTRTGPRMFYNAFDQYKFLVEFSQGRQSTANIKSILGHIYDDPEEEKESLSYIDIQVLNLVPKYINLLVGKINKIDYDFNCSLIDSLSIKQQKEYEAAVKTFFKLRKWMEGHGIKAKRLFEPYGIDVDSLTDEVPDEYLMKMKLNEKHEMAINAEKAIKLVHVMNNFKQALREFIWEVVVLGFGVTRSYLDRNNIPREEFVKGCKFICSRSDREDFSDLEYAGHLELISTHQFRKEVSGIMTENEIEEVIQSFAENTGWMYNHYYDEATYMEDGLQYIPVFRFQFLTEDTETYVIRRSQNTNNPIASEKSHNYMPDDEHKHLYKPYGGDREIYRITNTSKYGGTWVVDSDFCYNYDEIKEPSGEYLEKRLDYHVYAPAMKEGRIVSMAAQMIEPLFTINTAWNKAKEILARGFEGVLEVNFDEIEKVGLGKGGSNWSAKKVMKFLFQKQILIKRGKTNVHDQSYGQAIMGHNVGVRLQDYFSTIQMGIEMIENITGINKYSDASTPPERAGLGVMQMAQEATLDSLEHIFNAYHSVYHRSSVAALKNVQIAVSRGVNLAGSIGEMAFEYFEVNNKINLFQFGLYLERKPTAQEKLEFWQDVRIALERQLITYLDVATLRTIENLKEQRWYLAIREEKGRKERMQEAQMMEEERRKTSAQAAQMGLQKELAVLDKEGQNARALETLSGQIKQIIEEMKINGEHGTQDIKGRNDLRKEQIRGSSELIKQASRNLVESQKVDKRPDRSPED